VTLAESKIPGFSRSGENPPADERDFFYSTWYKKEFGDHGLDSRGQCSVFLNTRKGTPRVMNYQAEPGAEIRDTALLLFKKGLLVTVS
jgi:dTDP-4-dehydrorhamnose 3,5-epimerase-like enzyme